MRGWGLLSLVVLALLLPGASACSVAGLGETQTLVAVWDVGSGAVTEWRLPASSLHACARTPPAAALAGGSVYWFEEAFTEGAALVRLELATGNLTHWPAEAGMPEALGVEGDVAFLALPQQRGVTVLDMVGGGLSVREWPVPADGARLDVALEGASLWVAAGAVAHRVDLAQQDGTPSMWDGRAVGIDGERVRVVAMGSGQVLFARQVEPWHAGAYEHFLLDTATGQVSRVPLTLYVGFAGIAGGRLLAESQGLWYVADVGDVEASLRVVAHPGDPFEPWTRQFRGIPALVAFDGERVLALGYVPPEEPPMESNGMRIESNDTPAAALAWSLAALAAAGVARRRGA